jgi:predicted RND superfamily exporter protein
LLIAALVTFVLDVIDFVLLFTDPSSATTRVFGIVLLIGVAVVIAFAVLQIRELLKAPSSNRDP